MLSDSGITMYSPVSLLMGGIMFVLETRSLRKSFGEGEASVEALRGVDLGVQQGELLAIMGRSGSGKSTLLTLLGGVDVPTSGQVLLEGVDLATMTDDQRTLIRRRRIGFIFQQFNLVRRRSAIVRIFGIKRVRDPIKNYST